MKVEKVREKEQDILIRLFYVKDLIGNNEVKVMCCPTERMIVDCNVKLLVGGKFKMLRDVILNLIGTHQSQVGEQECVGKMHV